MDYDRLEEMILRGEKTEWKAMTEEAYARPVRFHLRGMLTRRELLNELQGISFRLYDRFFGAGRRRESAAVSEGAQREAESISESAAAGTGVISDDLREEMRRVFHIPEALGKRCPEGIPVPRCYRRMYGTCEHIEIRMDLARWDILAEAEYDPGREFVIPGEDGVVAYLHDVIRDTERNLMGYHVIRYQARGHVDGYSSPADRDLKIEICINPRPLLLISYDMQPEDYDAMRAHWKDFIAFDRARDQELHTYYEELADRLIREEKEKLAGKKAGETGDREKEDGADMTEEIVDVRSISPETPPGREAAPGEAAKREIQPEIFPGKRVPHPRTGGGALIAFEGIDGCGKSTQIRMLAERLAAAGVPVSTTLEPTDSPIGRLLRQVLVGEIETDPRVIAPLFVADRLDHLLNPKNGLAKRVEDGEVILTDRYYFSSYAYQSVDLPMKWVIEANRPCAEILRPALTIFLDVDPKVSMDRIRKNRDHVELFETEKRLTDTRAKYFEAFARLADQEKYAVVDGSGTPEEIADRIWELAKAVCGFEEEP